ncbi:acyl-CoA dehydrogenase domain-containing protein [Apiospora arundinis]
MDTHVLPHAAAWEAAGSCPPPRAGPGSRPACPCSTCPRYNKTAEGVVLLPLDKLDAFHFLILNDECARLPGGVASGLAGANVIGLPRAAARDRVPEAALAAGAVHGGHQFLPGRDGAVGRQRRRRPADHGGPVVALLRRHGHQEVDHGGALGDAHDDRGADGRGRVWGRGISLLVIPLVEEEDGDTDRIDTNPRERKRAKGITIEKIHNSGQNAGGASWVHLDHVRVPAENLLGPENGGFKLLMSNFNKERFVLAVSCNRQARTCLSTALAYALERETFGQPLVHHQVIRHKLTTLARDVEAHWAWLEQIAYHVDHCPSKKGWQSESIAGRIALAKVSGGRILELAAREAQQVMGGVAYQRDGPGGGGRVEQIARDLRMNVVGGGSEEILNDLAFREEMKRARKLGAHL